MKPYTGEGLGYRSGSPHHGVYVRCPDGTVIEAMKGTVPRGSQILVLEDGEPPPILLRVWFKSSPLDKPRP